MVVLKRTFDGYLGIIGRLRAYYARHDVFPSVPTVAILSAMNVCNVMTCLGALSVITNRDIALILKQPAWYGVVAVGCVFLNSIAYKQQSVGEQVSSWIVVFMYIGFSIAIFFSVVSIYRSMFVL